MDCEFTEEVSLLVDGELEPHEAARLRAHVEGCVACERAREAFLLLRQELRSYDWAPDPHVQSKALASILGSRTPAAEGAAASAGVRDGRLSAPREVVRRLSEHLTKAFGGRRLRPAHVAALALLLIGTALGLRWLAASNISPDARQSGAPALANTDGQPVRTKTRADAGDGSANFQAEARKPPHPAGTAPGRRGWGAETLGRRGGHRTVRERREELSRDSRPDVARVGGTTSPPSTLSAATSDAAGDAARGRRLAAADPALRIGRHAERVERLLRSFRNARLAESDPTLDVADARRLSKRLLYSNITLRREAAGAGDLPAEGWLDSLEPILLDISNLPDNPSPDAVGLIKDRIRRRQLVGVLQTQVMLASRP